MKEPYGRNERVGDLIKEFVASLIQNEIKDPRIGMITITDCEVSKDLRYAKIFFSVIGDKDTIEKSQKGLDSAKGFIKRQIGNNLTLRCIPELTFVYDSSLEYGLKIDQILNGISK